MSPALLKIKTPVYAFQARDGELAAWAVEIRERAALRLGELNAEGPKARGGRPPKKTGYKNTVRGAVEDEPYMVFPLEKSDLLANFDSKLTIDWGKGFLAWIQHADRKNKDVLSNGYNI